MENLLDNATALIHLSKKSVCGGFLRIWDFWGTSQKRQVEEFWIRLKNKNDKFKIAVISRSKAVTSHLLKRKTKWFAKTILCSQWRNNYNGYDVQVTGKAVIKEMVKVLKHHAH